jgi:iron complex outermembrane receptor protein
VTIMNFGIHHLPLLIRYLLLALLLLVSGGMPASHAAEGADNTTDEERVDPSHFELDEIVVTTTKVEAPVKQTPRNVTVITAKDIAESPSNNIIDLMSREVGINVRSFQGTDRQAVIDIRGMGATAASNVVVLVDGVKLNSPDLSGPDLSSISLDQIERIEVVRGSGGVLYGDGAVGGVVNIVTKKGTLGTQVDVSASYGSYDTIDTWASVRGGYKDLSYSLNGALYDSDGYRDNGFLKRGDIAGTVAYSLGDYLTFSMRGSHHEDEYGLPGPVSIDDVDSASERVKTKYPDDEGETRDNRLRLGIEIETERFGYLKIERGYRSRENDFIIGYSPLIEKEDQVSEIDEQGKTFLVTYDKSYTFLSREHSVLLGMDHYFIDYIREEAPSGPRKNGQTENLGFFINNRWSLTDKALLQLGYRGNRYEGRFRTDQLVSFPEGKRWVNGEEEDPDWYNDAWDLGLTYTHSKQLNLFASCSTSFRIPNVDERAESVGGLQPQKGLHLDVGGRFGFMDKLEFAVTFFNLVIEDEIYYSEVNRNYEDNTVRRGIEADLRYQMLRSLYLWGNYTYTDARFEKADTVVPLVPKNMASAGLEWRIVNPLKLSLSGTLVGERYDGNDIDNTTYHKLDPYLVCDTRATYQYGGFKLFAGINNLFDEMYSTVAYSEAYYPMPGRNFYTGVSWSM